MSSPVPDSQSSRLVLRHPTWEECQEIWTHTAAEWKDSLSLETWFEEQEYMTGVPLARDGGMTQWILVDGSLPLNQRPILAFCESIRKLALTSAADGNIEDVVIHGIASVFCFPKCRGNGYPKRMMQELATTLRTWQLDGSRCVGTILYSDIGKEYYAKLGWRPQSTNNHIEVEPSQATWPLEATPLTTDDLQELCARDETIVRKAMADSAPGIGNQVTILPTTDHMLWHIAKEDFACQKLFQKTPVKKGVIAGIPGDQVWAIWTHRYYGHPDTKGCDNVLYILRLVFEVPPGSTQTSSDPHQKSKMDQDGEQMSYLKAVLGAAQREAHEWQLDVVRLWDPKPQVLNMLKRGGINFEYVERQGDYLASAMWYCKDEVEAAPLWLCNEHYAWL